MDIIMIIDETRWNWVKPMHLRSLQIPIFIYVVFLFTPCSFICITNHFLLSINFLCMLIFSGIDKEWELKFYEVDWPTYMGCFNEVISNYWYLDNLCSNRLFLQLKINQLIKEDQSWEFCCNQRHAGCILLILSQSELHIGNSKFCFLYICSTKFWFWSSKLFL